MREILEKLAFHVLSEPSSSSEPEGIVSRMIEYLGKTHKLPHLQASIISDGELQVIEAQVTKLRTMAEEDRRTLEYINFRKGFPNS